MLIARRVLQAVRLKQDRDGDRVRADLLFCKAATDHGFKVWGDFTEMCHEYKRVDLAALRDVAYMRDISHADREDINTPEYWDDQWRKMVKDEEEPDRRFYRDIIESLRKRREEKPAVDRKFSVLDFGCGTGSLLEALGEWNFNAHGVDISGEAIRVAESRGLNARQIKNDELFGKWDAVVCCEVLEHMQLGKAKALIEKFFSTATDYVLYTVPYNCMPPGAEPQHRTVFTLEKIAAITPHLKNVRKHGPWALVEAVKP
jgi:SAM-dependent methyltransferase